MEWPDFLRENVDSPVLGFVALDYYAKGQHHHQGAVQFLNWFVDDICSGTSDPSLCHRSIVMVSVSLLQGDLSAAIDCSSRFLSRIGNGVGSSLAKSMAEDYGAYGYEEEFLKAMQLGKGRKNVTSPGLPVFISYSHHDKKYLTEGKPRSLLPYLKALEQNGATLWWDGEAMAGDIWDDRIKRELQKARLAIVLVSQSFLNSEYIRNVEAATFIKRRKEEGLVIVPIILADCSWQDHEWLSITQALPRDGKRLESLGIQNRHTVYDEIRKELTKVIQSL